MKKFLFILLFVVLTCKFLKIQKMEPIIDKINYPKESLLSKIIRVTKELMSLNAWSLNRKIFYHYYNYKDTQFFKDLITEIDQHQREFAAILCNDKIPAPLIDIFLDEIQKYHDLAVAQINSEEIPHK